MIIPPASNKQQNPPKIRNTTITAAFGKFYTVEFQTVAACNVYRTTSANVL